MDDFNANEIVCNGDFSTNTRDFLSVLWAITNGCDYRCSYCSFAKAKFNAFSTRENLLGAAEKLLRLNRPGYQITLYGGEPAYHPHFLDLIDYLATSEAPVSLRLFTNGSRPTRFFERMVSLAKNTQFGFIFSVHLKYAKIEHVLKVLEIVAGGGMHVGVSLMFDPEFRNRAREFVDALLELRENTPFFMNFCYPYAPDGTTVVGCKEEDYAWSRESEVAFQKMPMPDGLKSPFFTRIMSNITIERDGKRIELAPEKSLQLLGKSEMPPYKNYYCCAGTNVIFIEEDGTVRGSVCESSKVIGNIFAEPPESLATNMDVVCCRISRCNSIENIPLPKFRNRDEAEACVALFKERARAYLIDPPFPNTLKHTSYNQYRSIQDGYRQDRTGFPA